ncbi:MAG: KAP family NTPase, partial [Acidimicrobiia bacterium]|nr:KAP family NTPase [Acidimicrobiia bacterium]
MRRRKSVKAQPVWFFKDRAIQQVDDDHLDHQALAVTLTRAVEAADPPCMIGLMAEFGMGKSSTANLASRMLRDSGQFDTVTVSADKHSGNARTRNIVHSIAAELEQHSKIKPDAVREILRPIRQSTQVSASDPTDTSLMRFVKKRYSYAGLVRSLVPFALAVVVIGGLAWFLGAEPHDLLAITAASPVLIWLAAMTFARTDSPMGAMLKPATLTDLKPRAEAADEIEEVFGQLVDHHYNRSNKRLVVFIDDIDRLSKDDLLDALRALRSLQSVPRKREPIFVISCNEKIVQRAVGDSVRAPASHMPDHQVALTNGENETKEPDPSVTASDSPSTAQQEVPVGGEHDHPAAAFVDKLLTVRVHMPPTMRGDMRRFAMDLVGADHPLRSDPKIDLDRILTILVHDGVNEPRSVIRLLNRFVAAYLLGSERENSGRVYSGDVTHHLDVLAQLAVILDEFPDFHDEIVRNSVLLSAASKVALGDNNLTPSETDAVARSKAFTNASSPTGEPHYRQPTLGRYLASTARLVRYPGDVAPLVYFAASPSTRLLGAELSNRIVSALRVGNPEELGSVLSAVPSDLTDAAAEEISDIIGQAIPVDTPNILAAVAPNLPSIGDTAAMVADACADLLDRAPDELPPSATITHILDHSAWIHRFDRLGWGDVGFFGSSGVGGMVSCRVCEGLMGVRSVWG